MTMRKIQFEARIRQCRMLKRYKIFHWKMQPLTVVYKVNRHTFKLKKNEWQSSFKTKEQKRNIQHTKQIFPEQKQKKSFVLHHLFPVHEVLTGSWSPLVSGQIVNSFAQGKCTFDCQSGNLKNYASGNHVWTSSCMLWIELLITFNITCMCTFPIQIHSCMSICFSINNFINDLAIFTVILQC